MSIALVQSAHNTGANASSVAKAFTSANTAGNLLVVVITWNNSGRSFTSISDSLGNTYTPAFNLISTSTCLMRVYYVANCRGGSNTVTLNIGGGANLAIAIHEYSGVATTSPLDVQASATTTAANPTTSSVTDTVTGDLVFAATSMVSTTLPTAGTGYTIRENFTATTLAIATEDQIDTGTNSFTGSFTHASALYCAGVVTFKAATGGGGGGGGSGHLLSMMGCGM